MNGPVKCRKCLLRLNIYGRSGLVSRQKPRCISFSAVHITISSIYEKRPLQKLGEAIMLGVKIRGRQHVR